MTKLTDIEKTDSKNPINLKRKKKEDNLFSKSKKRVRRKDLSGTPKGFKFKIRLNELRAIAKYLHRFYRKRQIPSYKPNLGTTLPDSWKPKSLNLKKNKSVPLFFIFLIVTVFLLANFGAVAVNSATLKGEIISKISKAYTLIKDGQDQLKASDLKSAKESFASASFELNEAHKQVTQINNGVNLIPFSPLSTGSNLLSAGQDLSEAGVKLIESAETLVETQNLNQTLDQFEEAIHKIRNGQKHLAKVNLNLIPKEYQGQLSEIKILLDNASVKISNYEDYLPTIRKIFGEELPKRYLIAFLNSSESRPCGGFLGSFAIANLKQGALDDLEVFDTYTVDWQLWDNVEAPDALRDYMQTVHLRDSTYLAEFKECATEINFFYERAYNGSSLNGVIAIDETILEKLLAITGPIELQEYGLTLDQDNFFTILQVEIESSKESPTTPKQILLDFVPKVRKAIFEASPVELLELLESFIREKHLQAHFFDEKFQKLANEFNLRSSFLAPGKDEDFLLITDFNVGGNKSDRYIKDEFIHRSNISSSGEVLDTLIIKRNHGWTYKDLQSAYLAAPKLYHLSRDQKSAITYILGAGENKNVTQIFVPKGSEFLEVFGLEGPVHTVEKENYTIFYFDWTVPAGSKKEIILKYKTALKLNDSYSFRLIKQAGKSESSFSKEIDLGTSFHFDDGSTWHKKTFKFNSDTTLASKFHKN